MIGRWQTEEVFDVEMCAWCGKPIDMSKEGVFVFDDDIMHEQCAKIAHEEARGAR